ncbi:energy transducer TonB [Rhodovulum kholense]|uniref:Outer membrane transport energization protein TonB n=1 Tax=Rhodovulum kholense TaxID=453584 RepID=A0A8E3AQY3_9RHOB|nr:TonB family protein [Rhodovulum kholense]PTW50231.1 outer membrane transport energization protein TonB [Rhodovulum kholense]
MIPSSRAGKVLALGLALGAHGALALVLVPQTETRMEGRAGAVEAAVGASFADMAAGRLTAESAETVLEATAPPEPVAARPPDPVEAVQPAPAEALRPLPEAAPQPQHPAPPAAEQPPPKAAEPPPPETVKAEPDRQPRAAPRGNADRNARAGQAAGTDRAQAATSGSGGATAESGNAAASNYPGLVMRALSRVPKPRIRARGAAVVAFRLGADGSLASASVVRGSSSAALDQAALRIVQRAAPFPPPPPGAQRSFSIRIEGR